MEERKMVIQQLQKSLQDEYAVAQKYYSILSAINNLGLTKREIELVAFTAVNLVVKIVHNEEAQRHDSEGVDSQKDVNKDGDIRESDKSSDITSV